MHCYKIIYIYILKLKKKCYYINIRLVCHKYPRPDKQMCYCWISQWHFQQTPGVILTVNALFGDSCDKVAIIEKKLT